MDHVNKQQSERSNKYFVVHFPKRIKWNIKNDITGKTMNKPTKCLRIQFEFKFIKILIIIQISQTNIITRLNQKQYLKKN